MTGAARNTNKTKGGQRERARERERDEIEKRNPKWMK